MSTLLEILASDRDRPVLHDARNGWLTAGAAVDTVYRFARALRARGCGPDRVVALAGPLSTGLYLCSHAVEHVGGAQGEVPMGLPAPEYVRLFEEYGAAFVVADPEAVAAPVLRAVAAMPGVRLLTLGAAAHGEDLLAELERHSPEPFPPRARAGAPIRIGLTGGTTGRSKPVVRVFAPIPDPRTIWYARMVASHGPGARVVLAEQLSGVGRTLINGCLAIGGRCVLLPDFEPPRVAGAVQAHRASHVFLPTHQLRRLLDDPAAAAADLSSLRCVITGGGMMTPALLNRAVARLGPVVYSSYGQTEAGNIAWLEPEHYTGTGAEARRSCGRPLPGVDVEIRDLQGRVLGPGERGRVWVRTPLLMAGYLNRPEDTARVLREGWLDTQDIGYRTEEGLLVLLGRARNAISVAGAAVFAVEVDAVLQERPGVLDSASFGVPGPEGETLHSAVVRDPGVPVSAAELQAAVRERRGAAYAPSSVLFVARIPYTRSHDVNLDLLRRWHAEGVPADAAEAVPAAEGN
ncbi:AMP-binding protein [Streptomonospora nanhaiensis]|uniref:Fatty-acyl-CoA synthase n=1 Tax=Streptomonospora nanhaiensis TaxID=1323731 RepID=A0A853BV60_9ACTN|nr:AMP-binding protein [Streptomonospora nanhaiensis]MBV2365450.1 AMP-binding protein [Streptomonospora nanhaiensis]MBX9389732.1 AMP-binding protein [Streptomonospora nanhaiensis]NYI98397.1 fatty-acyl-CoA synthase [Streptomonospora nanhaiensis]